MATRKPAKPPSKKQSDPAEGSATRPDLGDSRSELKERIAALEKRVLKDA